MMFAVVVLGDTHVMTAQAAAWIAMAKKLMKEAPKLINRLQGARSAESSAITPKNRATRYRAHEALLIA